MELDEREIYFVYEWYDIDTGEIFYVGKGLGTRYKTRNKGKRNRLFNDYVSTHNCSYRKIIENVNEETACDFEDKRIKELKAKGLCSCNITSATSHRGMQFGKENAMYGVSPRDRMSPEKYQEWLKNRSLASMGKRNSQYGISIKQRMKNEEGYKNFCKSCSRGSGKDNPNAKPIRMWNDNFSKTFDCIKDCSQYLLNNNFTKNNTCCNNISTAIKNNKMFLGFYFEKIKRN